MTDAENTQVNAVDAVEENEEQKQIDVNEMQIAYLVGLQPDGNFYFQVFGKNQGLVELVGLHSHATQRLHALQMQKVGSGDVLVLELAKMVQALDKKVEALLNVVAPKQPDNSL